jgi:hypothetical protein
MDIWSILWTFYIFYGRLVYFVVIWYIFPHFGIYYQEKSGNPDWRVLEGDKLRRVFYFSVNFAFRPEHIL